MTTLSFVIRETDPLTVEDMTATYRAHRCLVCSPRSDPEPPFECAGFSMSGFKKEAYHKPNSIIVKVIFGKQEKQLIQQTVEFSCKIQPLRIITWPG